MRYTSTKKKQQEKRKDFASDQTWSL